MTDFGSRHKASHQDGGGDEIDCAGLVGRVNYVDRGDPGVIDYDINDFTIDGGYHDLDCSAVVPEGAKAIHIVAFLQATTVGQSLRLRKNGNIYPRNVAFCFTQVANKNISMDVFVACDDDQIIEYALAIATWNSLSMTIRGWLI